jgi:hypothetical protein
MICEHWCKVSKSVDWKKEDVLWHKIPCSLAYRYKIQEETTASIFKVSQKTIILMLPVVRSSKLILQHFILSAIGLFYYLLFV